MIFHSSFLSCQCDTCYLLLTHRWLHINANCPVCRARIAPGDGPDAGPGAAAAASRNHTDEPEHDVEAAYGGETHPETRTALTGGAVAPYHARVDDVAVALVSST